ncbi:MAG: tetratricopeptide repeat protein [bacterium]|nr:tetratricopeptide repeat protein [bacterium]
MAVTGRELLLQRNYPKAEKLFREVVTHHPDSLLGPFAMMCLYQIQNLENFDLRFESFYEPWQKKGRQLALKISDDEKATDWDLFLAGATLGISGLDKAHRARWLGGIKDGLLAIRLLKKALRKNPNFADASLGIGLYDYWRSVFTKRHWFLPFFRDRRQAGLLAIRRAEAEGEFTPVLAKVALAFIAVEEKKEAEAQKTLKTLLKKYPKNVVLKNLSKKLSSQKKATQF